MSGSFTPSANSLLVIAVTAIHDAGAGINIGDDLTISGGGLTFTKRVVVNDTTYWGSGLVIFTAAVGASPSSMTLTLDCGANNIYVYAVHVVDYTGYDTGTPTGATASTASGATNGLGAITLSAAPAVDSEVFATLHGESVNSSNSAAPGSGWTELYDSAIAYSVFQSQVRSGSTSTSVEWSDVSVDSGNLYESHMAALEIRAAVAGGGIAGSSALSLATTGALRGSGALSGASAFALAPVGILRGLVSVSGASTLTIAPTAALRGVAVLAGNSTLTITPVAVLRGQGRLLGASALALAPQASLSGFGSLLGNSLVTLGQQGALTGSGQLGGSSTLTFALTGALTSLGSGSLIGSANLAFTNQGLLAGAGALSGASQFTLSPSATIGGSGVLGGSTSLVFTPQGALTGILPGGVLGSSSITFDPVASLQGSGRLLGSTSLALIASANLVQPSGFTIDGSAQAHIEASFGVIRIYSNGINKFYTF